MLLILSQLLVSSSTVFISPQETSSILESEEHAIVLDARTGKNPKDYLPRAQLIDWRDYIDAWGPKFLDLWALARNAKLSSDLDQLRGKLDRFGFSSVASVIIYGDSIKGWGEEGRIWWMLKYLGLSKVFILDGGISAWKKENLKTQARPRISKFSSEHRFTPDESLKADIALVEKSINEKKTIIIDTRSLSEFQGATPYKSSRGGHIPSATHINWKTLFSSEGRILEKQAITKALKSMGADYDTPIITYCTGGVRSAIVQAALFHSGFTSVANYDGSWWEWSKQKDLPIQK